jgi:hypothetical protein
VVVRGEMVERRAKENELKEAGEEDDHQKRVAVC